MKNPHQNLPQIPRPPMEAIRPTITSAMLNVLEPPKSKVNPAAWTYERLANYINKFEDGLDKDHEIGAHLAAFGGNILIHIEDMGYHGPDIIDFTGMNDKGERVQLIQHIAQLNILLVAVNKTKEAARRIGYQMLGKVKADADSIETENEAGE